MITITYQEFPDYDKYPKRGLMTYVDSRVFDLEFEKDSKFYTAKSLIEIIYERFYSPSNQFSPEEDDIELISSEIHLISAYKNENEKIEGKELKRLQNFIKENLEII